MLPDFLMHLPLRICSVLYTTTLVAAAVFAFQLASPTSALAQESVCANGDVMMSLPSWMLEEVALEEPGNNEAQEISWCTSPDDPRCSPLLPQNDPSTRTLVGATVQATLTTSAQIYAPGYVCVKFATEEVVIVPGHRERLDRPPRV